MASNTHDPATVERLADVMDTCFEDMDVTCDGLAVAALDALTELGYGKTGPVYEERDRLVCALSKCFPAHLVDATDSSEGWSSVVIIELPTGQVSWHVSDAELPWFAHLNRLPNDWDGHDSATKYDRLSALTELGWRPLLTVQERARIVRLYDALLLGTKDEITSSARDAMDTLRALLAGGQHG